MRLGPRNQSQLRDKSVPCLEQSQDLPAFPESLRPSLRRARRGNAATLSHALFLRLFSLHPPIYLYLYPSICLPPSLPLFLSILLLPPSSPPWLSFPPSSSILSLSPTFRF